MNKTWGTEEVVPNALVRIEIIKAGGERKSDLFTTNSNGFTDTFETTLNLYKEQEITCIASVILTSVQQYLDHTWNSVSESLPWDTFYSIYNFGSSISKYIQLPIFGTQFNMF